MKTNPLLEILRDGKIALGVTQMYPASGIIESMCKGWDFVWIDAQHGEMSYDAVLHATQAATATGVASLIRAPGQTPESLQPYADLAPAAIMVPMVNTPAQAEQIVRSLEFPPLGSRSFGGRRVGDLYGYDYVKGEMLTIAQIETPQALDNAADIIGTEGVDCLFLGAADLRLHMGIPIGTPASDSGPLRSAMEQVARAAHRSGKFSGCAALDKETFDIAAGMGYQLIGCGADVIFIRTQSAQQLELFREASEALGKRPSGRGGSA